MACHFNENVYTTVFTPREYQVELLDTSKESNTIVCLGNNNAKTFVALKLLQELAAEVRSCNRIKSVFILDAQNVQIMSSHIRNLTDLTVGQFECIDDSDNTEFNSYQVLVMTSDICLLCIKRGRFVLEDINLLVIDDCRLALNRSSLRQIFDEYSLLPVKKRPRVLGLTTTVLSQNFDPSRLQAEFEHMEKILHSKVDTSSDIVTVLRYCSKPSEKLVLCANAVPCTLSEKLEMYIMEAKGFLDDHRYDPFEIYDDEFREELQEVPDPKTEPLAIFEEFLYVLHTMGPWCADRAAFALLCKIENLKVKIPYERHYLLLCMVSTVMVRIRAECDSEFQTFTTDHECIYAYSSPRVLRLLQVLRAFKPDTPKKQIESSADQTSKELQPKVIANIETAANIDATSNLTAESQEAHNDTFLSQKTEPCETSNQTNNDIKDSSITEIPIDTNLILDEELLNCTVENSNITNEIVKNEPCEISNLENNILENITKLDINIDINLKSNDELVTCTEEISNNTENSEIEPCEAPNQINNETETDTTNLTLNETDVNNTTEISNCNNENSDVESETCESPNTNPTEITNIMGSMTSMFDKINVSAIFDEAFSGLPWNEPENDTSITDTFAQLNELRQTIKTTLWKEFSVPETNQNTVKLDKETNQNIDKLDEETKTTENNLTADENDEIVDIIVTKGAKMFAEEMTNSKLMSQSITTGDDVIKQNGCDSSEIPKTNINPVMQNIGMRPWKTRQTRQRKGPNRVRPNLDPDALCAIVFVERRFIAKILYYLISELVHSLEDFNFLSAQYTVEKIADPISDSREAETEHRKQEEVLKKFRMHECNLLIATKVLEEGIDIPKCNLVIRFDQPQTYNSYVQCKGRAKMPEAHYVLLAEEEHLPSFVKQLAEYSEIEKMLLSKCKNREPTEQEEREADLYTNSIQPYIPGTTGALVSVATAVALVNKYCAKLPSDTFTRLTPLWMMNSKNDNGTTLYECSIRLPINSPLKQTITGLPMPNRVLARRVAALQVCRLLHQIGELDDNLLPVGKESFKAFEDDWNSFPLEESDELLTKNNLEPRPGTTKRRQYYYKRVADALTDCRPLPSQSAYLYLITMTLTCPLPEEQNTRGRKIYPPEDSAQGFGILTLKEIPKICPFPIFTRSGEVRVGLELASPNVIMSQEQLGKIMEFLNYIFTNVLRLQKYLMLFDPNASENSYFIVPTITTESGTTSVDWDFLNEIYEYRNLTPRIIPEEDRTDFFFNSEIYQDAVVMPWYRNQDQPQYFYVAEICNHLNPKSEFPGTDYKTFEEYYFKKYNIQIQNLEQPLLDVDHTSARLNFLTPRYVNRKGVALPTSSEETKKAKRENLEQKQILVPELCTVHPFPASLWRKAVCLPCILYRINALLLADQIRKQVAQELALGQIILPTDFEWSPLNFGWSLSDVLKKSKEKTAEKQAEQNLEQKPKELVAIEENPEKLADETNKEEKSDDTKEDAETKNADDDDDDDDDEDSEETEDKDWMEIGTWSNEMATTVDVDGLNSLLPDNITMCYPRDNSWNNKIRYGSPTSWMQTATFDDYDSDDSCDSYSSDRESSDNSNKSGGLRIEFKGDNVAEAIDIESGCANRTLMLTAPEIVELDEINEDLEESVQIHEDNFQKAVNENEKHIMDCGMIIPVGVDFKIEKKTEEPKIGDKKYESLIESSLNLPKVDLFNPTKNETCDDITNDVNSIYEDYEKIDFKFSFDYQPDLKNHPGPSPSVILQALTMSNANDGINLERLETIGDSFLKYAITNYLYSTYDNIHEGKLSHLRSKQVSNLNLYRLGRLKILGESMIATKFDPHDNWLPPCYYVPKELEQALIDARVPANHWNRADMPTVKDMSKDEICQMVREKGEKLNVLANKSTDIGCESEFKTLDVFNLENLPCFIPYNLITQHSIPDKSVADCVEALIGAYLIECGPRGALLFMAWLGIRVLPKTEIITDVLPTERPTGSLPLENIDNGYKQVFYGELTPPRSPLLLHAPNPKGVLEKLLDGFSEFERSIQYHFNDRSYLLQAMTHASYSPNTVTDCYQRLEFLGDAVLDYLITRHLYEDPRLHSPGALTDLRSALVNNTIFASLAVRHGFHKYFRHLSPGLHDVVNRFVQIQEENGHSISEEYYLIAEDESEEIEDVEVPKALGDVFESVAGAIFLDSSMSLDAVWRVYYRMMHKEIEQFSTSVPKSPIRELLELEPETAKFGKPEKLADGRRVRVTVEVFGKGTFKGIGRNYRIAKCTAAKCALKQLKKRG